MQTEIEADEPKPICKEGEKVESHVGIRIIQKGGDQAHRGAHQPHRSADDCTLENHGMGRLRVEYLCGKAERARASHDAFQKIGEDKLDENDRPDGEKRAEHEHPSLCVDRLEIQPVDDVKAVKDVGMNGNDHRQKRKDHSLKLISRHKELLFRKKNTSRSP